MTPHVIQLFATTTDYTTLYMSNDNGSSWKLSDNFTTDVNALDTVQYKHSINKNGVTNNISSIQGITPAAFYEASNKPGSGNDWKGTIKSGNGTTPYSYSVKYKVTDVAGTQTQDPKLQMKN